MLPSERARAADRHRVRPVTLRVLKCEECRHEHAYSPWVRKCPTCGSPRLRTIRVRD